MAWGRRWGQFGCGVRWRAARVLLGAPWGLRGAAWGLRGVCIEAAWQRGGYVGAAWRRCGGGRGPAAFGLRRGNGRRMYSSYLLIRLFSCLSMFGTCLGASFCSCRSCRRKHLFSSLSSIIFC